MTTVIADIELRITRAGGGATAALWFEPPGRRAKLASGVSLALDAVLLRSLGAAPERYAAALTGMVFTDELRAAWVRAMGYAEGAAGALRVRLALDGDDALHAVRWELLCEPIHGRPLAHSERFIFSRALDSDNLTPLQAPTKPDLRAVVAISGARAPQMAPVVIPAEVEQARRGLGDIDTVVLDGRNGQPGATAPAIADALRDGAHVLYLVCHGALIEGVPYLWLEPESGDGGIPIAGAEFVHRITNLQRRPLLVVLASCQSAGDTYAVLSAIGPQLARAGIGAVIAMQGNAPMELVVQLIPRLFAEIRRDGQIDRALAAARAGLPTDSPWWMPTLWMAVRDGTLWHQPKASAETTAPFMVPYPQNPLFRGRDAELKILTKLLVGAQGRTLPALTGLGGIGKTQLASEFAHRHRSAFPGGVFWISMAQPETIAGQIAAAGGPGGMNLPGWDDMVFDARVATVRQIWNNPTPRLIIFDGLDDPALLKQWRPAGGGARVLITTRRGAWVATHGVRTTPLYPLERSESIRLLLAPRYGEHVDVAATDPATAQAAGTICEQVGDLPLALALAGAYLEQNPSLSLDRYHLRLTHQLLDHPSLDADFDVDLPTDHATSVAATIALSYQQLDATRPLDFLAMAILQRAAQLAPTLIPRRLLIRLATRDPDDELQTLEIDAPLRRLSAVGLIEVLPEGHSMLHRLIAALVRSQDDDGPANIVQAAASLVGEIDTINNAGYPLRGQPYLPHLDMMTQRQAYIDLPLLARVQSGLGFLLQEMGKLTEAYPHVQQALVCQERASGLNSPEIAIYLSNFGLLLGEMGKHREAYGYLKRALDIHERVFGETHRETATSLHNLGHILQILGHTNQARAYFERALEIQRQFLGPIHPDIALSLNSLGMSLYNQRQYTEARPYIERALEIWGQTVGPYHPQLALGLNNLGAIAQHEGRRTEARMRYERALEIRRRTLGEAHPDTAHTLNNLGMLLADMGQRDDACRAVAQALAIFRAQLGRSHPDTLSIERNLKGLKCGPTA